MTFEEDLTKRRIDVAAFAAGDPDRFAEWQRMYAQTHPNSFYMSVKMVINDVRRRFWLAEAVKPVAAPVAEAPAKPAVRRATIPGAAKPTAASTPEPAATEQAATPAPPKARPVIRRPAITTSAETSPPVVPENNIPVAAPNPIPETPTEAAKAPRPRPVFRKPAAPGASAENATDTTADINKIAEEGTNSELPVHTNPDPEATAPKPPRPRPVFKRPVQPQNPAEQPEATTLAESVTNAEINNLAPSAESTAESSVPKPPRPRPIFKRPTAAPTSPEENNKKESGEENESEPTIMPVTQAILPDESSGGTPPTLEQPTEPVAAKPLRPRPVMRRPTPPAEASSAPTKLISETPVPPTPEIPPATEPTVPEPTEEPRKPPRPRPIFKRPSKPEEPGELA